MPDLHIIGVNRSEQRVILSEARRCALPVTTSCSVMLRGTGHRQLQAQIAPAPAFSEAGAIHLFKRQTAYLLTNGR
jgi:hypothetical protein